MNADNKPLLILQELFFDDSFVFRVHNVKLGAVHVAYDLPQMFLAHYDSLADEIKAQMPLSPALLKQINKMVRADEAAQMLGLPTGSIPPAWHIKISGTAVIVCDDLPLALHLQLTNTAKQSQAVYGEPKGLVSQEAARWQLAGNVNILHKNHDHKLVSLDLQGDALTLEPSDGYLRLPNSHALATTHAINSLKHKNPQALHYLHHAILEKATATKV